MLFHKTLADFSVAKKKERKVCMKSFPGGDCLYFIFSFLKDPLRRSFVRRLSVIITDINCIFDLQCTRRSQGLPLVLLQALYNEYVHFKETEIPEKEAEKGRIAHLYKLLEVRHCEPQMDEEVE